MAGSKRPLNSWGFDRPGTAGGQVYTDGSSAIDETNPYLHRYSRDIEGVPGVGDPVSDNWSWDGVVGRFGPAGSAGEDGADARGKEYIFTSHTAATEVQASKRPSNSWGYDNPGTADSQVYTDGASAIDETTPFLHRYSLDIAGAPAVNDPVADNWSWDGVVGRYGADGNGRRQRPQGPPGP